MSYETKKIRNSFGQWMDRTLIDEISFSSGSKEDPFCNKTAIFEDEDGFLEKWKRVSRCHKDDPYSPYR